MWTLPFWGLVCIRQRKKLFQYSRGSMLFEVFQAVKCVLWSQTYRHWDGVVEQSQRTLNPQEKSPELLLVNIYKYIDIHSLQFFYNQGLKEKETLTVKAAWTYEFSVVMFLKVTWCWCSCKIHYQYKDTIQRQSICFFDSEILGQKRRMK